MSSGSMVGARHAFTVHLNQRLAAGLVTVGSYDGRSACLTAVTASGDKVLVHNPHGRSRHAAARGRQTEQSGGGGSGGGGGVEGVTDTTLLHVGEPVTALCCGVLAERDKDARGGGGGDQLCIGTATSVLVYDVLNNADLFYRRLADGARAMTLGRVGDSGRQLLLVGGSCALQGFSADGSDPYWNVTGDTIRSLALAQLGDVAAGAAAAAAATSDANTQQPGGMHLLVGSDDHEIRVFDASDNIVLELTETAAVVALQSLEPPCFGYALDNGTIGVYAGAQRRWRIKSKHRAVALAAYDVAGSGRLQLVTVWSSGKVDARETHSGAVVFRDMLAAPAAGVFVADYKCDGTQLLVACSEEGEIRGYAPLDRHTKQNQLQQQQQLLAGDNRHSSSETVERQLVLEQLTQRRNELQQQLKHYQTQTGRHTTAAADTRAPLSDSVTAPQVQLHSSLSAVLDSERFSHRQRQHSDSGGSSGPDHCGHVQLHLSVTGGVIIRAVIVFAEGIFADGAESHVQHPAAAACSDRMLLQLRPPRHQPYDLHVRALIADSPHASQLRVLETSRQLPRFSMLAAANCDSQGPTQLQPASTPPTGYVRMLMKEQPEALAHWLNDNLLLQHDATDTIVDRQLRLQLVCLHSAEQLQLAMDGRSGQLQLLTNCPALASQLVQALAAEFTLQPSPLDGGSHFDFPDALDQLAEAVTVAPELRATQRRISADIAAMSSTARQLLLAAEDARLLRHMPTVRRRYHQLLTHNRQLAATHATSCSQHERLAASGRLVSQRVQQLAQLHIGAAAAAAEEEAVSPATVVSACRRALAANSVSRLMHALRTGHE